MSEALYNKMRERWDEFLYDQGRLETPTSFENQLDIYDNLAHEFCEEHEYSKKTEEFAFHGRWWDTVADDYYKKLEEQGWKGVGDIHNSEVNRNV